MMKNEVPDLRFWNEVCANDDPDAPPVKRLMILDDLEMKSQTEVERVATAESDEARSGGVKYHYTSSSSSSFSVPATSGYEEDANRMRAYAAVAKERALTEDEQRLVDEVGFRLAKEAKGLVGED